MDVDSLLWNNPTWNQGSPSSESRTGVSPNTANSPSKSAMVAAQQIIGSPSSRNRSPHSTASHRSPIAAYDTSYFNFEEGDEEERDGDPLSPRRLLVALKESERKNSLLEIDIKALTSKWKTQTDKCAALEEACSRQERQIDALQQQLEGSRLEAALLQEQLGQSKLHLVALQDSLALQRAADAARVACWDTFRELYTLPSSATAVDLAGRHLDDAGAAIVAAALEAFPALSTLSLADNAVGPAGMAALAPAVAAATALTRLDLSGNLLAAAGAAHLAAALL